MHLRGSFGTALERLRGQRMVTLARLAEATGFDVDDLVDIEHGRWHPPWRVVLELADGMGLDLVQRRELREAYVATGRARAANRWIGGGRRAS